MRHSSIAVLLVLFIALLSSALALRSCDMMTPIGLKKDQVRSDVKSIKLNNPPESIPTQASKAMEEKIDHYNKGVSAFDDKVKFWGKVVDQDGQPIEGVDIKASVTTLRMVKTEKGYREFELLNTISKRDGTFRFIGAEGFSLTIEQMEKEGYVLPSVYQAGIRRNGPKYFYRYKSIGNVQQVFHPNPLEPVIFHLWKLSKPEPLFIVGQWGVPLDFFKLPEVSKIVRSMDCHPGADPSAMGREAHITIEFKEIGTPQSRKWEVIIAAIGNDGGVIKADPSDALLFTAPESGYTQSISFQFGPEGTDQHKDGPGAPVRFFVRCKNGQWHAAVESVFFAPDEAGQVVGRWRQWLNPNGSRNLEHDAAHPLPEPVLSKR